MHVASHMSQSIVHVNHLNKCKICIRKYVFIFLLLISEKVPVKLKYKDTFRHKRSADRYPNELSFEYTSSSLGKINIDLKKNNIQTLPPVLLYDGNELKNKTDINIGVSLISHYELKQN